MADQKPGGMSRAWRWANTPLATVPPVEEQFDPETGTMQPPPAGGSGSDLVSGLTTPLSIGTTVATGGAGAATALGRGTLARLLATPGLLADLLMAWQGGRRSVQGLREGRPGEVVKGAGQAALAGAGAGFGARAFGKPPGVLGRARDSRGFLDDATLADAVKATNDPAVGGSSTKWGAGDLGGQSRKVAVGVLPETAVTIPPERLVTVDDLRAFVENPENNKLLQRPRMHLGTWKVGAEGATEGLPVGTTVLDVGGHPPTRSQAMGLAGKYDQKAIFDLGNFTEVQNPAFAGRDLTTRPQQTTFPTNFQRRTAEVLPVEERIVMAGKVGAQRAAGAAPARSAQRDARVDPEALRAELLALMKASVGQR